MTINNSAETIEELIKGKVWIDEIDQRCLFESDVKKLAKEYGSYMFLQGIEAVKGAIGEQQEWEVEQNNGDGVALLDHVLKNLESLSLDSTKE